MVEGLPGDMMVVLGRFAWVPLLGVLAAAGFYRGLGAAGETPLPSPMITDLPEGPHLGQEPPQEPVRAGLVRMLEAGLSEEIVASQARSVGYRPSADDLIDLKAHGASEWLLGRMIGAPPAPPDRPPEPAPSAPPPPPPAPPTWVAIETAGPPPVQIFVAPRVEITSPPPVGIEAPLPEPIAPDVPIYGAVLFRPSHHRQGLLPFARAPRVLDPAFRTVPFIPNLPLPAPSILQRGAVAEGRVRGR